MHLWNPINHRLSNIKKICEDPALQKEEFHVVWGKCKKDWNAILDGCPGFDGIDEQAKRAMKAERERDDWKTQAEKFQEAATKWENKYNDKDAECQKLIKEREEFKAEFQDMYDKAV